MQQTDTDNHLFQKAFQLAENSSVNLFITGKAGTGKSTLLRHFRDQTSKNVIVLSPTGISAINVQGSTIHSFFKFPLRPLFMADNEIRKFPPNSEAAEIIKNLDTIIIDEVSMVRADIIDAIDYALKLNTGNTHRPFGGKQMIFFGDLFQLPPVQNKEHQDLFDSLYDSHYFFDARIFKRNPLKCIELTKVYRQDDPSFIDMLDKIRMNKADKNVLDNLNSRYIKNIEAENIPDTNEDFIITLCTTNKIADNINQNNLGRLDSEAYHFTGQIDGTFDERNLPTDLRLTLKTGAQVMFIRNDPAGRWVNGTLGKIKSLDNDLVEVELENSACYEIDPVIWENKKYTFDSSKQCIVAETIGNFTQYPLKLAWAVTIHKSQGLTLNRLLLDLGWGAFAHGQLYVALSRCSSLNGLFLKQALRSKDIIVDENVIGFLDEMERGKL